MKLKYILALLLLKTFNVNAQVLDVVKENILSNFDLNANTKLQIEIDSIFTYIISDRKDKLLIFQYQDSLLNRQIEIDKKRFTNRKNKFDNENLLIINGEIYLFKGEDLYIFSIDNLLIKLKNKINLKTSYNHFTKNKTQIFAYSFNALNKNMEKGKLLIFDVKTLKITLKPLITDFPIATTFFPNNFVDPLFNNENKYIISNVGTYSIRFYENFKLTDSIVVNDESIFAKISKLDSITYLNVQKNHQSLQEITAINTRFRFKYSHIWSVYYISEDEILVRISNPKNEKFDIYDHYWKKEDGVWNLKRIKNIQPFPASNQLWVYFSMMNKLVKHQNYFYFLHYSYERKVTSEFISTEYFHLDEETNYPLLKLWKCHFK